MKRRNVLSVLVVLCIAIICVSLWGIHKRKEAELACVNESLVESPYDVTLEKQKAKEVLAAGGERADIVTDEETLEKYIGLAFQGLSDTTTNQKILAMLEQYDRKVMFFLPAIEAVECEDDVIDIVEAGHDIGSCSLRGESHLENLDENELINNLCAANKVLQRLTEQKNMMLQGVATKYTDQVLRIAKACGNEKVVYSTTFINYQSFTSYEQVKAYIEKLPRGTILTIKMQGVLDEIEMEEHEVEEKPEKDMKPTIDPDIEAFQVLLPEEKIVTIVEWILQAIEETEYKTKRVSAFAVNNHVNTERVYDDDMSAECKQAMAYSVIETEKNYLALQVQGIDDTENVRQLLKVLQETKQTATFFVTAQEIMDHSELIQEIIDAGCELGNGGISTEKLTGKTLEEVTKAIQMCNQLLQEKYGVQAKYVMPPQGLYDETVQKAVANENMTLVTFTRGMTVAEDQTVEQKVMDLKKSFASGKIYFVNMSKNVYARELLDGFLEAAKLKKYQIVSTNQLFTVRTENTIRQVLSASEIALLKKQNAGRQVEEIRQAYTTERALAFSFSGIQEKEVVRGIVEALELMQAKGTFFIRYDEMKEYPNQVKTIIDSGNEVGIAYVPTKDTTFASACNEIALAQEYMLKHYGTKPSIVMNTVTRTKDKKNIADMKEAISAMGCRLIGNSVSIIQDRLKGCTTSQEYYEGLTQRNFFIQMGQIVYTRLDYISHPNILPEVLMLLKQDKIDPIAYYDKQLSCNMWAYAIKKVSDVIDNTADQGTKLYQLNSGESAKNVISYNQVDLSNHDNFMMYVKTRYIGNPDVGVQSVLPGFVKQEIDMMDKTGKMYGNYEDRQVFLSFDDWGTDVAINHLLYVLDKYGIKATFFVRSNNVASNPNLLRAIAMHGHEIGSHTSQHKPLSNYVETQEGEENLYESLTAQEAVDLRKDLVQSYEELYKIVGDVTVNGYSALVPIFRPPTLAVSKVGLLQVFETGYQYCISGDLSTADYTYNKTNNGVEQLFQKLENGVLAWNGKRTVSSHSIIIMHMSDASEATPEAIDQWMQQGIRQKYRFDIPMYQYIITH